MFVVFFGLAIATKFSVSPLIIPIILSHVISGNFFGASAQKTLKKALFAIFGLF